MILEIKTRGFQALNPEAYKQLSWNEMVTMPKFDYATKKDIAVRTTLITMMNIAYV